MWEFTCAKCGKKAVAQHSEGTCPHCGVGYKFIPADYTPTPEPKEWPTL